MMRNRKFNIFILTLFIIVIPLFILLISYKMILFFTPIDIDQEIVINFLSNSGSSSVDLFNLGASKDEISHLYDVKDVMRKVNIAFYFSLLVVTLSTTYFQKDKLNATRMLFFGGISSLVVILILLINILFMFDFSFNLFHQIFFPQGNWTFPAESFLIQTFPIEFFISISTWIMMLSLFFSIVIFSVGLYLWKKNKSKRN